MAVGIDFLSKTKIGGMKDIMGAKGAQQAGGAQKSAASNSIFANNKSEKATKPNMGDMDSSSLLKYVYGNGFKNDDIQLPNSVEFGGKKFDTNGHKFDDVVKDICKQTGESKVTVETELKKQYISAKGGKGASLNMQA